MALKNSKPVWQWEYVIVDYRCKHVWSAAPTANEMGMRRAAWQTCILCESARKRTEV